MLGDVRETGVLEKPAFPPSHKNVQPETHAWVFTPIWLPLYGGEFGVQMDMVFNLYKGEGSLGFRVRCELES